MMKRALISLLLVSSFGFSEARRDSYYYPLPRTDRIQQPLSDNPPKIDGYNSSARIDVRNSWMLFLSGSFIFWQPREEGLELATSNDSSIVGGINGIIINNKEKYKPGFKAGFGIHSSPDDWEFFAQYTWYRVSQRQSSTAPESGTLIPRWFSNSSSLSASNVKQKWKLRMDLIDTELGRPYYMGKHVTMRPFLGVRGGWIRQRLRYHAAIIGLSNAFRTAKNRSRSWAVGPRAGIDTRFLIGLGFRVYGNASSSLLYTRYKVNLKDEDPTDLTRIVLNSVKDEFRTLRPNAEFEFGLGWGSYFSHYRFHIDLSISYDFKVFWYQNVMRHLSDSLIDTQDTNYGNLYLQGLTSTLRFDF